MQEVKGQGNLVFQLGMLDGLQRGDQKASMQRELLRQQGTDVAQKERARSKRPT